MQMSYLYASDFPFTDENFCKLAQHAQAIRKNVWQKSNDAYSLSIRVQSTINHIRVLRFYVFHHDINVKERELKKALRDTLTRAAWLGPSNFWSFLIGSF